MDLDEKHFLVYLKWVFSNFNYIKLSIGGLNFMRSQREIQNDIYAVYGFVRIADEIVDTFHEFDKETLLNEFEADLKFALDRKIK